MANHAYVSQPSRQPWLASVVFVKCFRGDVLCRAVLFCAVQASGADLVIALTHMRQPNDVKLAKQVPEIDAVLGGHDHFYNASDQWLMLHCFSSRE